MKIVRVIMVLALNCLLLGGYVVPAYCSRQFDFQDPELSKKTVKGTVSNVSRMGQKISVSYKDESGESKEVVFSVDENTRVVKSDVMISSNDISGIMTGDKVVIQYFEDPQVTGDFTADTITLESR
jgi:hypothetical protein